MSKVKLGQAIVKGAIKQIKKVPGAVKKIAKAQRAGTKGTKGAKGRKSRRPGTKAAVIGNTRRTNLGARSRRGGVTSTRGTRRPNLGARSRRGGNIAKTSVIPPIMMGTLIEKKPKETKPKLNLGTKSVQSGPKNKRKPTPAGEFVRFSNPRKSGFARDSKGNKIRTGRDSKAFKKIMEKRKMGGGK